MRTAAGTPVPWSASDDRFAGAQAAVTALTNGGLFFGQSPKFFQTLKQLAEEADAATREL
ncbi:MAG: hypothetical protein WCA00_04570 [Candidatus Acidiferrales bacterium]